MGTFLLGLLGGVIAWLVTTVIGQPILNFINLREEAAADLAQYEWPNPTGADVQNAQWLSFREGNYEGIGAKLAGFAASNYFAVALLDILKFDPKGAGEALLTLSRYGPGATERPATRDRIIQSLRLKFAGRERK